MSTRTPEVDQAVSEIIDLMLANKWRAGASHREFAKRYGVSTHTVRTWSSQAARFIRQCRGSEDDIREAILTSAQRVTDDALGNKRTLVNKEGKAFEVPAPDHRSALQGLDLMARVHGVLREGRGGIGGGLGGGTIEVSIEEIRTVVRPLGFDLVRLSAGVASAEEDSDP